MSEKQKRLLFLCANRSLRAHIAASLLLARARETWDVWCTPALSTPQQHDLARIVLDEIGVPLLVWPQTTEPDFGLSWDVGVILCSGTADA